MLRTDENGHVAYRILANRLEEHANEERLLLEGVQIEYHPANEVPWIITAGNGSARSRRSSTLRLIDLTKRWSPVIGGRVIGGFSVRARGHCRASRAGGRRTRRPCAD